MPIMTYPQCCPICGKSSRFVINPDGISGHFEWQCECLKGETVDVKDISITYGTSSNLQRDNDLGDAKKCYDNHMSNTLWSLDNAIRMMQRRRRLSIGANREKYERMLTRLKHVQDRVYALLDDVFETEDDVIFSESKPNEDTNP